MPGEEDSALLAKKRLVDKEVTLGYFLVKAEYLKNVKKLVKYEQNIDVCEKDDVDQQFTMQFIRYTSSKCSYFKGDGLKSYFQKMGAQANNEVKLEYDEGTFFIAFIAKR
ncbi:hypothetical protein IFM89_001854 [Coptis chinensis]|uniref:Uncharacterized protein n=1 Tax=Coptis chinensis TaxID=261450 RepID=A0A835HN30_9MAGN|nr:hypothetical protein IFM89_001854 [Coptis chinensis]